MMEEQFFLFGGQFDYYDNVFADVISLPNCHYVNTKTRLKSPVTKAMYRVHNSGIANKLFKLPFRSLWYKYLFDAKNIGEGYNHFIFWDSNPHVYSPDFLKWIRNKVPNSTLTIYFANSMKYRTFRDMAYFKKYFDLLYTSDTKDASDTGMILWGRGLYSKQNKYCSDYSALKNDIFFVGLDKGRGEFLKKYYCMLNEKGLSLDFTVVGIDDPPDGMFTDRITYDEVLNKIKESKAIFEVVLEGIEMPTMRFSEAIVYNKILITNSPAVKRTSYYPSPSIYFYERPEDLMSMEIDWNQKVDYQYNGERSPLHFLTDISNRIGNHTEYYFKGEN